MTTVHRIWPITAIAVALAALAPSFAGAQTFEGIVTMKVHGGDSAREPREMQYSLRQGAARIDMAVRNDARAVMIFDRDAKTTTMLMPAQKKYLVVPISPGIGEHRSGDHPRPEIVRTGRKETIAGYECEHWLIKEPEHEVDACVASGLGSFMMSVRGREESWTGSLRDQQGFPLKVARVGGPTIMEVTKIEKKALDASLFVPPADYQKIEMPAGPPPGQRQRP
jgi:hypothetical protein